MPIILCLAVLIPDMAEAQGLEEPGIHSSIGFRAGYGVTAGNWSYSRVAPAVQQFGGGLTYGGDITLRLGQKWGIVLAGTHTIMDFSRWEEYASSKEEHVGASASLTELSLSFRPLLFSTPTDQVGFEVGAVGLFASGKEVINGESYDYDFFSSFRLGFQGALQYDRLVSDAIALTIRGGVVVAPEAMRYADGETRTMIYLPVTAGMRFIF
jgi:hypothetical protein